MILSLCAPNSIISNKVGFVEQACNRLTSIHFHMCSAMPYLSGKEIFRFSDDESAFEWIRVSVCLPVNVDISATAVLWTNIYLS